MTQATEWRAEPTPLKSAHGVAVKPDPHPPTSSIVAAMLVGTVSMFSNGIQPELLGALTQADRASSVDVGHLAAVEMLALAAGSAVSPWFHYRGRIRLKVLILALLLMVTNLGVWVTHSIGVLLALRGAAGMLEGFLLGAAIATMAASSNPPRLFGLFWGLSALPMALASYLLPQWIVPRFGPDGGFGSLALVALAGACASWFLIDVPRQPSSVQSDSNGHRSWNWPTLLGLAGIVLQCASLGAVWSYQQLLADQLQIAKGAADAAVSTGIVAQVVGSIVATVLSGRLKYRPVILGALAAEAVLTGLLPAVSTPGTYVAMMIGWNFLFLAALPAQVEWLIANDPSNRSVNLTSFTSLVGLGIGPAMCAVGANGPSVSGAFWIASALMAASACCYLLPSSRTST